MGIRAIIAISSKLCDRVVELRRSAVLFAGGISDARRRGICSLLQGLPEKIREYRESKRLSREVLMKDVLLIDDVRVMPATRVARTYDEGIAQIKEKNPDLLLLDHDLGHEEPEKTGYGIVCFLEENNIKPKEIRLVTSNPVGAMRMEAALESMGYRYDQMLRTWYVK